MQNATTTLRQWEIRVLQSFPEAVFTLETGAGETYGEPGSTTAHTGPDLQADVVGVFVPGDCCWVLGGE